ncbi:MAG TPA: rhomboid family intramembrane serine protease [Chitinophagales bacterium]|nr:rhomboid family intramembrane serine protease [Chitinophagales bacterium]
MIPLGDDNTGRVLTPYVNYIFILINVLVFILLQQGGSNIEFTYAFSTVPAEIISGQDIITPSEIVSDPLTGQSFRMPGLQPTPIPVWLTLLTSMFMHGGFAHIIGNMLYLFIFGDNIENRLGHKRYLVFYLLTGILASLSHVFTTYAIGQNPLVPSLGASGAISGVLGGYLVLFPRNRVHVLLFRFVTTVPAIVALGFWILFQIISGLGMLGGEETGVAYAAHLGGFMAGLLLIKLFDKGEGYRKNQKWERF